MGFKTSTARIEDGTPVNAATTNPCLDDLQGNILYLKAIVDALSGGESLVRPGVAMKSDVAVANAVYWNGANSRYELAVADDTYKDDVAGICLEKTATTAGNLLTMGWKTLDITGALGTAEVLTAGRYFLSRTEPGKLVATRPNERAIPVLIADGQGNIIVLPQTGNRGWQGYRGWQGRRGWQGNRGWQGFKGFQGVVGPTVATAAGVGTGTTTTNSYVSIYDSGTVASGLLFSGTIKNTGGSNGLSYRLTLTDAFGTTDNLDANVAFGSNAIINSHTAGGTATPPYTRVQVFVKAQVADSQTTYSMKLTRTAG